MEKREYKKQTVTCKHNVGVECEPRCAKCHKCGWNPEVDKERRESDCKPKNKPKVAVLWMQDSICLS